ncbi:Fic family protein [Rhizobium sp. P28RR-XV]|uniref:Fic family protein n=1 Tax=Rhizobium sp. P28RR-XV TaxID=2726737 RepID=UPI0014573CAC|nr:Fic family protein [Rhizobium sp. P28RR-XV]NLR86435.1 Fic family protein [Rhizobium sp. P28RR-XV]
MTYIWQSPNWPAFEWQSDQLATSLAIIRLDQGRLIGRVEGLGFRTREATFLRALTDDVVKSSAIEGERLDEQQVRSSLARRLGINIDGFVTPNRSVEGIVHITLDATIDCFKPLTAERLFQWHAALFPTGRNEWGQRLRVGGWRDDSGGRMEIMSGAFGHEKVHYVAPPADRLEQEMTAFLDWFNGSEEMDPLVKAAVAHLWFVAIHPFGDGNGRITRAIADMTLARGGEGAQRLYSMSAAIEKSRTGYYEALQSITAKEELDITKWIQWFLDRLGNAVGAALQTLDNVILKNEFWQAHAARDLNPRQAKVLNWLLEGNFDGKLTSTKWAKLTGASQDTASRDISDLLAKGILRKGEAGGRSTAYELVSDVSTDR